VSLTLLVLTDIMLYYRRHFIAIRVYLMLSLSYHEWWTNKLSIRWWFTLVYFSHWCDNLVIAEVRQYYHGGAATLVAPVCRLSQGPCGVIRWWRTVVLGNCRSTAGNQSNLSYSCDVEISSGATIDWSSNRNKFASVAEVEVMEYSISSVLTWTHSSSPRPAD